MQLTVTTIIFGLPFGQFTTSVCLTVPENTLTVRELIARKVSREFEEYSIRQRPGMSGEYRSAEELLQSAVPESGVVPGAVTDEIDRAHRAFAERDYMIVVDNRRLWSPDEEITLQPTTQVEFIKVLLVVGG